MLDWHSFRTLCEGLSGTTSRVIKQQLLTEAIATCNDNIDNVELLLKMLMTDADRDRSHSVGGTNLLYMIERIYDVYDNEFESDTNSKLDMCYAIIIKYHVPKAENLQQLQLSTVDDFLSNFAMYGVYQSRCKILKAIFEECNCALDAIYVVKRLLKKLCLGASTQMILQALHVKAYDTYLAEGKNLRKTLEVLMMKKKADDAVVPTRESIIQGTYKRDVPQSSMRFFFYDGREILGLVPFTDILREMLDNNVVDSITLEIMFDTSLNRMTIMRVLKYNGLTPNGEHQDELLTRTILNSNSYVCVNPNSQTSSSSSNVVETFRTNMTIDKLGNVGLVDADPSDKNQSDKLRLTKTMNMLLLGASYGTGERKNIYSKYMFGVPNSANQLVVLAVCGHGCTAVMMKKIHKHVEEHMTSSKALGGVYPLWLQHMTLPIPDMLITQENIAKAAVCSLRVNLVIHDGSPASINFPRVLECYTDGEKTIDDVIRLETIMLLRLKEMN